MEGRPPSAGTSKSSPVNNGGSRSDSPSATTVGTTSGPGRVVLLSNPNDQSSQDVQLLIDDDVPASRSQAASVSLVLNASSQKGKRMSLPLLATSQKQHQMQQQPSSPNIIDNRKRKCL